MPTSTEILRERNQKVVKKHLIENEMVKTMRESMKRRYGSDPVTDLEKFPIREGRFSWKKLEESLRNKLSEADTSSAFTQFLRAGLQQVTNGMYEATPVTYTDWVTVVPSNKAVEIYAPNQGIAFPRQVGSSEQYPEVGAAALDLELRNNKYGTIYALEKELLNDDQSGTFAQQQGMLGEYLAILAEVLCYGKLASVANMKYLDYSIPVSETKPSYETNYPYSQAFRGGGKNRPASYAVLNQANVQAGIIGLMNQKNLQGIKMLVQPKTLVISPQYNFDASVLLNSAYYPSGAAAAGSVGGAFAVNMLKGILDLTVSRFVFKSDGTVNGDSTAWYIMDNTKPFFVLQQREPVAVEMENPNSGESFNRDIVRYKGSSRMNADFLDPRFVWQGNDGSV